MSITIAQAGSHQSKYLLHVGELLGVRDYEHTEEDSHEIMIYTSSTSMVFAISRYITSWPQPTPEVTDPPDL